MSDIVIGTRGGKKSLTLTIQYTQGQAIPNLRSDTSDGFTRDEVLMLISYLQHFVNQSDNQKPTTGEP